MAGRISEYLDAGKLTGDELVDFSVVDAGSPTGYSTRKKTLADVAGFNPTLYSASSDLLGNRTVNQDGNTLFFNDGDFGLDFGNDGFIYEDLTRRVGIGTDTPLASTHIKGQSGDDLLLIENSLGNDRLIISENGQIATGSGTNAVGSSTFGQTHRSTGFDYGFGFYPTNSTTAGFTVQMTGTTKTGLLIQNQGDQTGVNYALNSRLNSTSASQNITINGQSEDGSQINIGVRGSVTNNTNSGSIINTGVYGLNSPRMNYTGHGGLFESSENNPSLVYTNIDFIGVEGKGLGGANVGNTGTRSIGGIFIAERSQEDIALLVPSTDNDGVVCFGQDNRQGDSILQTTGGVRMQGLPTSSAGLATGELYNDAGTLKIA